jgi:hypothetical protein
MRKLYNIFFVSLLALTGCTESYTVYVNGFAKVAAPVPPNAKIFVATEPNSDNPIFAEEVKNKIEKLLASRGYVIQDNSGADYLLTFQMGMMPQVVTDYRYMSAGASFGSRRFHEGFDYYAPYVETVWDQWLRLKLYRDDTVVWVGEAVTSESYADKRKTADYLIVAALEYFGQDTASRKSLEITAKDPRIAVVGAYAK